MPLLSRIKNDAAKRQTDGRNLAEAGLSQDFHKLIRRRERADRRRQVGVRRVVARQRAADARQHAVDVPASRPRRTPGAVGTANSRIARRPPGFSTRYISAHAASMSSTLRMPNADRDGVDRRVAERDARRVARTSATRSSSRALAQLLRARRAASRRRSRRRPRAPRPAARAPPRSRDRRAGAEIEDALAAGQPQRSDRARPPAAIDARRSGDG